MKLFRASLLFVCVLVHANSTTQTDWSGGPGTPGPVVEWASVFAGGEGAQWALIPGQISIERVFGDTRCEIAVSSEAFSAWCDDMDADGDEDVLVGAMFTGPLLWCENTDPTGTEWSIHVVAEWTGAYDISAADLDGDGDLDILKADGNMTFVWLENVTGTGDTWVEHPINTFYDGANGARACDFDCDGDLDVLAATDGQHKIHWWENTTGSGTVWVQHQIASNFGGAMCPTPDDIDGDGDTDVAAVGLYSGDVAWFENTDGVGGTWEMHLIGMEFTCPVRITADDLDGDGDHDLAACSFLEDQLAWWENIDGFGELWVKHIVSGTLNTCCCVASEDLDLDGDIDLLSSSYKESRTSWWENTDGTGLNWTEHLLQEFPVGETSVLPGFINDDAYPDVIGTSMGDNSVSWWDVSPYYPEHAVLESSILDTDSDPDWEDLSWSATTPAATTVAFQIRASDDYTQMGAWSDTITAPCSLHGILEDNARYVQYRAILETADPDTTPSLLEVTVTWDPLGTGGSGLSATCLLPVTPNPSGQSLSINVSLAEAGTASLSIYDLSGRLVYEFGPAEYPAGALTIQLQELRPGIYFVRMRAGELTANQRFVVVE